jgi:hypothetical protein
VNRERQTALPSCQHAFGAVTPSRRQGAGRRLRADGAAEAGQAVGWVPVLQLDPELAARRPEATLAGAAPFALARTEWLDAGEWRPRHPTPEERVGHLGLLVVEGFLARRVQVLDRPVTELLGRGDLLRRVSPASGRPARSACWPPRCCSSGPGWGSSSRR